MNLSSVMGDLTYVQDALRAYGAALYNDLLEVSSLHGRLPELYEDAAGCPPADAFFSFPSIVEATEVLQKHASATRELIVALEEIKLDTRRGYERPAHWAPDLRVEAGWHDDAWTI
jgi:hypothetical protein